MRARQAAIMAVAAALGGGASFAVGSCGGDDRGSVEVEEGSGTGTTPGTGTGASTTTAPATETEPATTTP